MLPENGGRYIPDVHSTIIFDGQQPLAIGAVAPRDIAASMCKQAVVFMVYFEALIPFGRNDWDARGLPARREQAVAQIEQVRFLAFHKL